MCVCNFEMCVCDFEKREMKYELHFQLWITFLTLCSVIDFVCVVTPVGHRMYLCSLYTMNVDKFVDLRHLISCNCNATTFMHSIVTPPRKMKLVYELDACTQTLN